MRAKIRPILEECIENGIWAGMEAARKHTLGEEPYEADLIDDIEYWIWQMIDERFDFDRSLADEIREGLIALKEQNASPKPVHKPATDELMPYFDDQRNLD